MNAPATIARPKRRLARGSKRGGLFVTDAELIEELGVPEEIAGPVIRMLDDKKVGFPKKNPLWGNRRYLPAVQEWLLRTNLPTLRPVNGGTHD